MTAYEFELLLGAVVVLLGVVGFVFGLALLSRDDEDAKR